MFENLTKPELIAKLQDVASKKKLYKYLLIAVAFLGGVGFILTGNKETAMQLISIGSELALVEVQDGNVEVVSSTSPVSVTEVVSDTIAVSKTTF